MLDMFYHQSWSVVKRDGKIIQTQYLRTNDKLLCGVYIETTYKLRKLNQIHKWEYKTFVVFLPEGNDLYKIELTKYSGVAGIHIHLTHADKFEMKLAKRGFMLIMMMILGEVIVSIL